MTASSEAEWIASVERYLSSTRPEAAQSEAAQVEAGALRLDSVAALRAEQTVLRAERPVLTTLRARQFNDQTSLIAVTRPKWELTALPHLKIDPTPILEPEVRAGNFILWPEQVQRQPESDTELLSARALTPIASRVLVPLRPRDPILILHFPPRQAYFARSVPRLIDLALTVESTVQPGGGVRVSGGSAVFTISVYAEEGAQVVERYRNEWAAALKQADGGNYSWKFQPVALRDLQASLEIPQQHLAAPPQVSINSGAGTATFVVQLSEAGVLLWKAALEQSNAQIVPGVCRLQASYYAHTGERVVVRTQDMSATLGALFAGRGPSDVRVINPQQSVEARLVVSGHDLIQRVVVSMRPNTGQAPVDQVFDQSGGEVDLTITTQDVGAIQVDWTTKVMFTPSTWPVIPQTGTLSNRVGWSDLIKPESWVAQYTFMALLVDAAGDPLPINRAGENYHVNGVLTFTAPYIPVTGVLVSPFDLSNQQPVNVALPRVPDQPFGDLLITIFATRDGRAGTQTRRLSAADPVVIIQVFPDARLELITNSSALAESSALSPFLANLTQLNR